MEGLFSALNVETDRIDHTKRAGNRAGNRLPVVNIGCNRAQLRIIAAGRVRVSGCNADRIPLLMQITNDPAPEKAGPAKHGHSLHHGTSRSLWLMSRLLRALLLEHTFGVDARSPDARYHGPLPAKWFRRHRQCRVNRI